MDLLKFNIKRLFSTFIVIIGISIITFVIVRIIPANPAAVYLGPRAQPDQIERLTMELGLNKPMPQQYLIYVQNLLKGDWGDSLRTHRPVLQDIINYLPNSLELLFFAIVLSVLIGIPLGVIAARHQGKWLDHMIRVVSIFGVSVPSFWIALVLQFIFFSKLGLLPINGQVPSFIQMNYPIEHITGFKLTDATLSGNWVALYYTIPRYILPVFTLALYPLGLITRMTRSNLLEVLEMDYIKLANSNGISQRKILFHYALKNAMAPVLTVIGLMFAYSVMGSFFVEIIYNWPGIGRYAVQSIMNMDQPAIMGVTLLIALIYVITNLITDLLQAWLDPRIRLGGGDKS